MLDLGNNTSVNFLFNTMQGAGLVKQKTTIHASAVPYLKILKSCVEVMRDIHNVDFFSNFTTL